MDGRGRPPAGYFTRRLAEEWLDSVLVQARAGTLPGAVRTGVSFADACDKYLRFLDQDRQRKPTTLRDARSIVRNHLLPTFGDWRLEDVSAEAVERWARELGDDRLLSNRSKQKLIVIFHGLMERARRVWKLPSNPVRDLDRPHTPSAGGIDVFSPEEVLASFVTPRTSRTRRSSSPPRSPACARGELVALRWRNVDFPGEHVRVTASYAKGALTSPKSGKVRAVPMAPAVGEALARLSQRDHWTRDDDLVFPGIAGTYLDASGWINEKTQVWRWADVARWFSGVLGEQPAGSEHAAFLAALNDALDLATRAGDLRDRPDELEAVRRFLPEDLAPA